MSETLDARAQQWRTYDQEDEARTRALYDQFPELEQLPAASDEALAPALRRHTYKGAQLEQLHSGHAARRVQEQAAQQFAERAGWFSPPVALTVALERVSGMGPEAAAAYRGHVVEAFTARLRWIVVQAWHQTPLDQADFDDLLADAPAPFVWQPRGLAGPATALLVWLLAGWLLALFRLTLAERRFGDR